MSESPSPSSRPPLPPIVLQVPSETTINSQPPTPPPLPILSRTPRPTPRTSPPLTPLPPLSIPLSPSPFSNRLSTARSTRLPRIPPPTPSPLHSDVELYNRLQPIGYTQYYELFVAKSLTLPILQSLTSAQLRDDLHIQSLRHRKEILRVLSPPATSPEVPAFGSILVHLSNVRTFHSWLVTGTQLLVFGVALVRIAPGITEGRLVSWSGVGLVAGGVLAQAYGIVRYWTVMRRVERGGDYYPDSIGTGGLLFLELAVAAAVLYVLLSGLSER